MTRTPNIDSSEPDVIRELRIHDAVVSNEAFVLFSSGILMMVLVVLPRLGLEALLGPPLLPVAMLLLFFAFGTRSYLVLRHRDRPVQVSDRRLRTLMWSSTFAGVSWGLLNMLLIPNASQENQVLLLIFAMIGMASSMAIRSTRLSLPFFSALLGLTAASALWVGFLPRDMIIFTFAAAAITGFSHFKRSHKETIANIKIALQRTRALKDQLVAEERLRLAEVEAAQAAQERQAQAAAMQRDLINALPFPMVLTHGNEALQITPQARSQFGVANLALADVTLTDFFVDPKQQERIVELLRRDGQLDDYELLMHDASDVNFWVTLSMRPLVHDGKKCWLNAIYVIDARKRVEQELAKAKDSAVATLDKLKSTQQSLIHAEKMASLGQLTAGIAHEIKNPLNFVNNFSKLSAELLDELAELLQQPIAALVAEEREDAEDLLQTLRKNLLKIDEHGRRADSIVKNMLLHSRQGSAEKQPIDLNALIKEAMNLAYHGARASDKSFNVELVAELSAEVGVVHGLPQELQRVILNLCSNGMYEAVKRSKSGGEPPKLTVSSRRDGGQYQIDVTDNGGGVPPEIREKIFQPFFTTKPTGEGTGLGLSMSYDIVKQHGGSLILQSEVGQGTTFQIRLPATEEEPKKKGNK